MSTTSTTTTHTVPLPRISITFCTQCKWMLRAAYFAQELLSTFSGTTLGEVALIPATGGLFQVHLTCVPHPEAKAVVTGSQNGETAADVQGGEKQRSEGSEGKVADAVKTAGDESLDQIRTILLWDRKTEGGFPETKVLKQKVRDWIEPGRDLGHSDRGGKKGKVTTTTAAAVDAAGEDQERKQEEPKEAGHQKKEKEDCEDCR